jgi:hypothetical protein
MDRAKKPTPPAIRMKSNMAVLHRWEQPRIWASMHQVSIWKGAREYKEEIKSAAARNL